MIPRSAGKWERRVERARELADLHPAAGEALRLYERLARFQKSLYAGFTAGRVSARPVEPPGSLRDELEPAAVLSSLAPFLALIQEIAPFPLAHSAAELAAAGEGRRREVLEAFWRADGDGLEPAEAWIAWTFLQPHAEALADRREPEEFPGTPPLCPRCGGPPQAGVLRPLGDGGKRSLICALCATEWPYRRIVCPTCGEEDVDKLPVYATEELPHVRVEACDTCRHYLKTIDMTKDGHAVPVVDELAAIPLSLWAVENGYTKGGPDLLGL